VVSDGVHNIFFYILRCCEKVKFVDGRQKWRQAMMVAEQCRMAKQVAAGNGSCVERHLVDDDTKVYPTEVVYKPSLFVFYYLKRLNMEDN
jgi:hypothetical protein